MAKETRFLFVPETSIGKGSGHLLRCLKIASHLDNAVFVINESYTERLLAAFPLLKRFDLIESLELAARQSEQLKPEWIVFDKPLLNKTEIAFANSFAATIAFDGRGPGLEAVSYVIDILPRLKRTNLLSKAKISAHASNQIAVAFGSKPLVKILVSFGGEDPAHLRTKLLNDQRFMALCKSCQLDFVRGSLSQPLTQSLAKNCNEIGPFASLDALFKDYDLVITSFGLTAYEALAAGKRVLLFNPAKYHEDLSQQEGFDSLGVKNLSKKAYVLLSKSLRQLSLSKPSFATTSSEDRSSWATIAERLASLENPQGHSCPACQSSDAKVIGRFEDRTFFVCRSCQMYYLHLFGQQTIQYQEDYFFSEYAKQYGKTYLDDFDYIQSLGKLRLKRIMDIQADKKGTLLDIGCAYGPFLIAAKQAGFEVMGCDISQEAVNHVSQKLGIEAVCGDLRQLDLQSLAGPYDVVSMWYVIEHFPDLHRVLTILSALVKKGGVLALSTPSAEGVSAKLRLSDFLAQSPRDHYSLWRPRKIKKLLALYGFKLIKTCSTGHHPERFKALLAKPIFFKLTMLISRIFSLGDTFEVYARKTKEPDAKIKEKQLLKGKK